MPDSLSVKPIADEVLRAAPGEIAAEVEMGEIAWSNELALHVIELKTNGPAAALAPLAARFSSKCGRSTAFWRRTVRRLMPTAMHPWMDPDRELRFWPHDYNPIYEAFNRIFDCRGHGWANLQSVHSNLPFADDEEFGRLHAAIRLLLPILPALAASSPVMEGRVTGLLDTRIDVYRTNSRTHSVAHRPRSCPNRCSPRRDYDRLIFQRMYSDIAPHDPEKILQHEFLNSPAADRPFQPPRHRDSRAGRARMPAGRRGHFAAAAAVLKASSPTSVGPRPPSNSRSRRNLWPRRFSPQFATPTRLALKTHTTCVNSASPVRRPPRANCGSTFSTRSRQPAKSPFAPLENILEHGPLSRRITRALGYDRPPHRLVEVYRELCDCLTAGRMFLGL